MPWDESQYIIDEVTKSLGNNDASGFPPSNIGDNASVKAGNAKVTITCTPPPSTMLENQKVCTCKGVRIVRKVGSAPVDQNDGVAIADVPAGLTFNQEDTGLSNGTEYFYGFFPYSDHGVININPGNVRSVTPQAWRYWGFNQNFADLNPATTITYPEGLENSNFAKMHTNKDNGTVTAGDWMPFLDDTLKNHPYMVKKTGEADYPLNPRDYSKKLLDGSASDYQNTSYSGGCFAWINKIYMREEYSSDGNSREVRFCDGPADGFDPIGFYDKDQNELEGVWIPMGYCNQNYVSLASVKPDMPNIEMAKTYLEAHGPRFVFFAGPIMNVLRDLLYMLFKSTNIQKEAGYGQCAPSSTYNTLNTGNIPTEAVIVPGWFGNGYDNSSRYYNINYYFNSGVLGANQTGLMEPYFVSKRVDSTANWDILASPYYVFYENSAHDKFIKTPLRFEQYNSFSYVKSLKKAGELLGSLPLFINNNSQATGTTGLCDYAGPVSSEMTGDTMYAIRLGFYSPYQGAGPAYFSYRLAPNWSINGITYAAMLLPSPGYSPFN